MNFKGRRFNGEKACILLKRVNFGTIILSQIELFVFSGTIANLLNLDFFQYRIIINYACLNIDWIDENLSQEFIIDCDY